MAEALEDGFKQVTFPAAGGDIRFGKMMDTKLLG